MSIYSAEAIAAAREWVSDCVWADVDQDDIDTLTDEQIVRGVNQYYSGGMRQMISDSLLD